MCNPLQSKPGYCPEGKTCGIRCTECSGTMWSDIYNSYIYARMRTPVVIPTGEINPKYPNVSPFSKCNAPSKAWSNIP